MALSDEFKVKIVDNLTHGKPALADLSTARLNSVVDVAIDEALADLKAEGRIKANLEGGGYVLVGRP